MEYVYFLLNVVGSINGMKSVTVSSLGQGLCRQDGVHFQDWLRSLWYYLPFGNKTNLLPMGYRKMKNAKELKIAKNDSDIKAFECESGKRIFGSYSVQPSESL